MKKILLVALALATVFAVDMKLTHAKPNDPYSDLIRTDIQPEFTADGFSSYAGKTMSMYVVSVIKNAMGGTPIIKELLAQPISREIPTAGAVSFPKLVIKSREDAPYNAVILLVHEKSDDAIFPVNVGGEPIIDHSRNLVVGETLPARGSSLILLTRYLYRNQIIKQTVHNNGTFYLGNDL